MTHKRQATLDKGAEVDRRIAGIAARQHGLVTTGQLLGLPLTRQAVQQRVAAGRLHTVHRGVHAVGHPRLTEHARMMAAVLAAGPGAALSHRSAAHLWRIRHHRRMIEVTAPNRRRHRRGIRVHQSRTLAGRTTTVDGIPVTTVARTLTDLADVVVPSAVKRALETAERLGLVDRDDLRTAPAWRVRPPETNQDLGRWEVDFLELEERGYRVLRVDGESLDLVAVSRRLRALLHQMG